MSCGCERTGVPPSDRRSPGADCGCDRPGRAIGSRVGVPWGGTRLADPSPSESPRPLPIGARPSVAEPQPFEARIFPNDRSAFGDIVYGVFGGELELFQGDVARMVNRIPPERWTAVRDFLFTVPPGYRMPALSQLVGAGGLIDPAGRMYPLPDPGTATATAAPAFVSALAQSPGVIYAPPPPEPQRVCLINGYDPRWGAPPDTYKDIAMPFDPSSGVYGFDRAYVDRYSPTAGAGRPLFSGFDLTQLENAYASGWQVLQPFKRTMSAPWEFRWVFRAAVPVVECKSS